MVTSRSTTTGLALALLVALTATSSADAAAQWNPGTIEQSIVPMGVGSSEIPSMSFSYFDPETQSYVTKTTNPIPIEVVPGNSTVPAAVSTSNPAAPAHSGGPVPDQPRTGLLASLRPVVLEPWFLTGNALMVAATMVLLARVLPPLLIGFP